MKNTLCIILLISFQYNWSQIKIASTGLELKKGTEQQEIVQFIEPLTDELFVSASDKEKVTLFKFNRALFLDDSLEITKDKNFATFIGHSFLESGEKVIYYSTNDYKKIMAFTFDYTNRKATPHLFTIPFNFEQIIAQFSTNNQLYLLSLNPLEKQIKCYAFEGNYYKEHVLNLSDFKANITKNNTVSVVDYIQNSSIQVIDNTLFNPLYNGSYKTKLYPKDDKIILTVDSSSALTQVLEIDLNSFEIVEKIFLKPEIGEVIGNSNSYLFQDKLFQINSSATQLIIRIQDYSLKDDAVEYSFNDTETPDFKNSPFLIQTGNSPVKELKKSKKFLSRMRNKSAGITVYETENNYLVTIGGTNMVLSTESLIFSSLFTAGSVLASGEVYVPELYSDQIPQNVFFECRFDESLKPRKLNFYPLANDYIGRFLDENRAISLYHTIKFYDFYLMSFYDAKEKQLILRKFENGSFENY